MNEEGNTHRLAPDHPDAKIGTVRLMEAIGTGSFEVLDGLLSQLANAGSQGPKPDERGINFMLSVVEGIAPKDEVEAMLATQMAAVHMASMTFARRLAHVDNIPQQDSAERAFNKLARTFTAQVDALKRYRTGGQQKVTVEHCACPRGRASDRWDGREGEQRRTRQTGRMPCQSTYLCTSVAAAEPRHGAGARACPQQWRTEGAGCTAARLRGRQQVSATPITSTDASRRKP